MPRPVCVTCNVEFRCKQNDIIAEELATWGSYRFWAADLWECPLCGFQIVHGFGREPIGEHYQDDYAARLARHKEVAKKVVQFGDRHVEVS